MLMDTLRVLDLVMRLSLLLLFSLKLHLIVFLVGLLFLIVNTVFLVD